jgi:23S rRNA pseudouridine955/2504/2580 synthase
MLLEIPVSPNDAGQRAERFLRRYFPHVGLSRLQSLFRRKEIKIAKRPVERGYLLRTGDVLQVYGLKPEETRRPDPEVHPWPAGDPIPAVYEDDEILVVNKPAGVASHPGTGIAPGDSLIERVQAQLGGREEWSGEIFSPSLVHRLDKDTSGVLLVAKTGARLRGLVAALREGQIRKRYLALVVGHPKPASGDIDAPLSREDNASGAKSRVAEKDGRPALTRYRTLKKIGPYALLQVIIETGRLHQIRAHLAHIGHPVVGDTRYDKPVEARQHLKDLGLKRIFLHADEVSWDEEGATRTFNAPLPPELLAVVEEIPPFA